MRQHKKREHRQEKREYVKEGEEENLGEVVAAAVFPARWGVVIQDPALVSVLVDLPGLTD